MTEQEREAWQACERARLADTLNSDVAARWSRYFAWKAQMEEEQMAAEYTTQVYSTSLITGIILVPGRLD